jgi:hypothetical protein
MKKAQEQDEIIAEMKEFVRSLHDLADEISRLESHITGMSVSSHQNTNSVIRSFLPVLKQYGFPTTEGSRSNIIPFPASRFNIGYNPEISSTKQPIASLPYLATPGSLLPSEIPDFRMALQRDGLILLGWDKRFTETGERFTAYWVTSVGIPRFYASKSLLLVEFPLANPDHKSYAAEDGIEFYGQKAPAYIVHLAPELLMSNPKHGELRMAHINMLKLQGSKVNFNYKYLLKSEKNRKPENPSKGKAG